MTDEKLSIPTRDSRISLRGINDDTVRTICRLSVHPDQRGFVADNATSIARALELVIEHIKTRQNASQLFTSVVQAPGGPRAFHEGLGFQFIGDYDHGEAVLRLEL